MLPQRADEILKRGYDYGQSRVQCGVHWQSDVEAGRVVGSAVVAHLHAIPEFIEAFQAAKAELEAAVAATDAVEECPQP